MCDESAVPKLGNRVPASTACWMGVIVCGRMITLYRPLPCERRVAIGFLEDCIVR